MSERKKNMGIVKKKVSSRKKLSVQNSADKSIPRIPVPAPERVETWGMNASCMSPVFRPKTIDEIQSIIQSAIATQTKIGFRGGGCSYGDASINSDGWIVDLTNFNRILDFNPSTGVLTAESGVTIKQIWEFGIERGFWPPVVSGTMFPTLGGALSMNIHGKNNFQVGTIGEHIQKFSFLTGTGKILECTPTKNSELFYSAISGFGMLGCFLVIQIRLKKIYSGKMKVWPVVVKNFREMFEYFEREENNSDYLVGWVDAFAKGKNLGRGLIHKSVNLKDGEDPDYPENCKLEKQNLPTHFFGIIPKSWMWIFMKPFSFPLGMQFVNSIKYLTGFIGNNKPYYQGHAEYSFLLDYVPNWKFMYKPGYMIQYQSFIPKENAEIAFREMFLLCQKKNIVSWLAVFKRHKPDPFLLTHAVDGYSMALDFPVSDRTREKVWALTYELDEIVLKNGGRFYFAKDSTMRPGIPERFFPNQNLIRFHSLKKKYDPYFLFQTDLYKRIFGTS